MVRMIATTLRRSGRDPKLAETMVRARGSVALRSQADAQACTIRFAAVGVHVERGRALDADVTIELDFERMNEADPPKPKVSGAARHPRLALAVAKLLDPPRGSWTDEARRFFAFAQEHPEVPRGMLVVCTDRDQTIGLGESPAEYELHGRAHWLTVLFSGNSILGEELLAGRLCAVGTLRHTAVLTGRSIAWALGD